MQCAFVSVGSDTVECRICGRPLRTKSPPERVHRRCRGVLNWRGRLLARLEPGDGVAIAARYTGMGFLTTLWEEITGRDCGCSDRQKWLNMRWQQFVWEHFAEPVSAGAQLRS